jgi:NADH:ubiquinone oxidoreductase subunit 5 (subunit L)/multisubunit Na+/H+ antiporter MnhA subunit
VHFLLLFIQRLIYLVFLGKETRIKKINLKGIEEASLFMSVPMVLLVILSIISGFFTKELFMSQNGFFRAAIININGNLDNEFVLAFYTKLLPTFFSLFGILFCLFLYYKRNHYLFSIKQYFYYFQAIIIKRFYFDYLYNNWIFNPIARLSYIISYKYIDRGVLEKIGPTGLYDLSQFVSKKFQKLHTGYIFNYIFFAIASIILILLIVLAFYKVSAFYLSFNLFNLLLIFILFILIK